MQSVVFIGHWALCDDNSYILYVALDENAMKLKYQSA